MLKNNLKKYRTNTFKKNDLPLTKTEFAQIINISVQQYLRYENGGTVPSLEVGLIISQNLRNKAEDDNIESLKNITVEDIWFIVPDDDE